MFKCWIFLVQTTKVCFQKKRKAFIELVRELWRRSIAVLKERKKRRAVPRPMSLAFEFLGPQFSQDALECSKEICRTVLETVDSTEVRLDAWEDVATSLAKASVAKLCEVNIAQLESMSIQSIAPQSGRGAWSLKSLKSHPRKDIMIDELEVLIRTRGDCATLRFSRRQAHWIWTICLWMNTLRGPCLRLRGCLKMLATLVQFC